MTKQEMLIKEHELTAEFFGIRDGSLALSGTSRSKTRLENDLKKIERAVIYKRAAREYAPKPEEALYSALTGEHSTSALFSYYLRKISEYIYQGYTEQEAIKRSEQDNAFSY